MRERTEFDIIQKYSKFLLEIMTLVSSANNIGSDKAFIGCMELKLTSGKKQKFEGF
jgi:hypothetical protein